MASSLLAALTQQAGPALQTRKGLIILGLQNDFISSEGKLPVNTETGFLDRLKDLVSDFRKFGTVFWVRSEYEQDRSARDEGGSSLVIVRRRHPSESSEPDDDELFLARSAQREPCCLPGTKGAEYAPQAKQLVDDKSDVQIIKTHYSAFEGTSLLSTLRIRLITDLYVCGCLSNIQVYATAMDAARYAIAITLVENCLGYRKKSRHEQALKKLREATGAESMSGREVLEHCRNPPVSSTDEEEEEDEDEDESEPEVHVEEMTPQAPIEVPPEGLSLEVDEEESQIEGPTTSLPTYSRAFAIRSRSPKVVRPPLRSRSSKSSEKVRKRDDDEQSPSGGKASRSKCMNAPVTTRA